MKNYEKPIVLANSELSEGVFAASGGFTGYGDGYNLTLNSHQTPETGRNDYRYNFNVSYASDSDQGNTNHILTIEFNQPVDITSVGNNGRIVSNVNGVVQIEYTTPGNSSENIGLGDLIVQPTNGGGNLDYTSATMTGYRNS